MRHLVVLILATLTAWGADLGVSKVVLFKNGVAWYERSGEVAPGEPARLQFQAAEMNDVLKSLLIETPAGVTVNAIRYDLSEPLKKRLGDIGIVLPPGAPLSLLLDQWKGARLSLRYRGEDVQGQVVGGRLGQQANGAQRQELNLMLDSGEIRLILLDEASALRLADPRLQQQLRDALQAQQQAQAREKKTLLIDVGGSGNRRVVARYLAPAPVWKSSYRLVLPESAPATLEGWAVVENATGEDWRNVELKVVSGRPVSFVSRLYEPRFLERPEAALPEDQPARPVLHEGAVEREAEAKDEPRAAMIEAAGGKQKLFMAPAPVQRAAATAAPMSMISAVSGVAEGREAGELFEYSFPAKVSAGKGESLLLPFVQQRIDAKRLTVYSDRSSRHPRVAAELTNSTGKTLDGGPVTVFEASSYAGEALMETLKAGDKRLISFAEDLGTRVTTALDSGNQMVREIRANRGVLTTKTAIETTTTYTIGNVDQKAKVLTVEHPIDRNQKLLKPQAVETTATAYRFTVPLPAAGTQKLGVVEERILETTTAVASLTPPFIEVLLRNRTLSEAGRKQLEVIAARKASIDATDRDLRALDTQMNDASRDEDRIRQNINTLSRVAGQQEQVQKYAAELSRIEASMAQLRDRQAELRKKKAALEAELNALIEKLEF